MLQILITGTPILLFYGLKPVFRILEDIENYLKQIPAETV